MRSTVDGVAVRSRAPGFYWVRSNDRPGWHVAEWCVEVWFRTGNEVYTSDKFFAEIGERVERGAAGWAEPQPITDAHKTGEWWLVWFSADRNGQWIKARWISDAWFADGSRYPLARHLVSVCLPLPPDVKP